MPLSNVRIVLVRPRGAANLGAVARAMKNTGLHDLVLVRPAFAVSKSLPSAPSWATAMAVHAKDVLGGVRQVDSLDAAVSDCGLVVGTTCREGLYRAAAEPPREVAPRILAAATANRVAVVFGPEDHGLSNDDLKACHQLIIIPTNPAYPSLNLSHAVMVCGYELFVAAHAQWPEAALSAKRPPRALASAERVALMFRRLQAAFLSIGFLHADNPDHIMYAWRRMLGRAQMEDRDVRILLALARQIEWFGCGGFRVMMQRAEAPPDEADGRRLLRPGGEAGTLPR